MGYLIGIQIYKYGGIVSFLCRGYYVDTLGKNQNEIKEYIKNQL